MFWILYNFGFRTSGIKWMASGGWFHYITIIWMVFWLMKWVLVKLFRYRLIMKLSSAGCILFPVYMFGIWQYVLQVISLICYLMETKNDRGPFLVVVPSSVLPGWESEINFWAPSVHKIVYSGPPEERRRLFK